MKKYNRQKGFALLLSLFIVIGLEMMMVGNLLQTMRQKRDIQRIVSEVQINQVANAVVDRGLRLFREYMVSRNAYPSQNSEGIVNGSEYSGADFKPFNVWLSGWYDTSFKPKFPSSYEAGLNQIIVDPAGIVFKEDKTKRGPGDSYRIYKLSVVAKSDVSRVEKSMSQTVKITMGNFSSFSAFSNENIEITAGPNFTLQGPIFSNKNIYMMNASGSTLTLKRAYNFASERNPEPYVMNSAGHIYFGFQTAVAKNYALTDPRIDPSTLLDFYKSPPGGLEMDDTAYLVDPTYNPSPSRRFGPRLYVFSNGLSLSSSAGHAIKVENSGGSLVDLSHNYMGNNIQLHGELSGSSPVYLPPRNTAVMLSQKYRFAGKMNYSGAIDSERFPTLSPDWSMDHPERMSSFSVNPAWVTSTGVDTVADVSHGVTERVIPIGDPSNPSGTHLLIEPLTTLFPPGVIGTRATTEDTPEVIEKKFQAKADLNLYVLGAAGTRSTHLGDLRSNRVVRDGGDGVKLFDYRLLKTLNLIEIDIGKLVEFLETTEVDYYKDLIKKSGGILIYVHVYPVGEGYSLALGPHAVRLINGSRLPKNGLTVTTNGRLFIQGDYNTYSYKLCPDPREPGLGDCTVSQASWDLEDFHVPSAAIFTDSLAFLSSEWVDPYGRAGHPVPTSADMYKRRRIVSRDMMVNVVIGTGTLQSQLIKTAARYFDPRTFDPLGQDGTDVDEFFDSRYDAAPRIPGHTYPLEGQSHFYCPNGDISYKDGRDDVSDECEFYQRPSDKAYYVNKKSLLFKDATVIRPLISRINPPPAGVRVPLEVTYASWVQSAFRAQTTNAARVNYYYTLDPVTTFANKLTSILRIGGGYYLSRPKGAGWRTCGTVCSVSDAIACPGAPGGVCTGGQVCIPGSGEIGASCSGCRGDMVSDPGCVPGPIAPTYMPEFNGYFFDTNPSQMAGLSTPLYVVKPSGGLENLINLQEQWDAKVLRVSGTFSMPWIAKELHVLGTPAFFYIPTGVTDARALYSAPERRFDFNEGFQENPPPGTPGVFSIVRKEVEM